MSGDLIPDDELEPDFALGMSGVPKPVDWRRLDPHSAAQEWAILDEWVRWLVRRYDLEGREIPPCWHLHGTLIEELSALRGAHRVAFDPAQMASGAADWHRLLWDTRIRTRDAVARAGCTERTHNCGAEPAWIEPSEEYAEALRDAVRDDVNSRSRGGPSRN